MKVYICKRCKKIIEDCDVNSGAQKYHKHCLIEHRRKQMQKIMRKYNKRKKGGR